MNNSNFFSRRIFFKNLCLGAIAPMVLPTSAKSEMTIPISKENTKNSLPDLERVKEIFGQKDPVVWLFTGASITQGALHLHGHRSFPEIFSERVRYEMGRYRDFVVNTGISGATSAHILNDFEWRVARFKPQVVSLSDMGANDCRVKNNLPPELFEKTVDTLLTRIQEIGAIPILHTPTVFILKENSEFARMPDYVPIIRNLATTRKIILIDNFSYWQNAIQNRPEIEVCKNWLNDPDRKSVV